MPATGFIGRELELDRIQDLLSTPGRLITLVGHGGIGKTRLAAEVLRRLRRTEPHRPVFWTNLVDVERDSVPAVPAPLNSILRAQLRDPGPISLGNGESVPAQVPAGTVLVLDNCEHVLAGVGQVAVELLNAVPHLTILATSREPIGWSEEYIVTVPPLRTAEAVDLFRRRADLTGRPIADHPEQLTDVRRICQRVDNNPLFIQLAAARLRHQPPTLVLAELTGDLTDGRLRWSAGISSDADHRHRGVSDVIAWSFDLCERPERILLERLSVFAAGHETDDPDGAGNGVEVEAVIAVCADDRLPAQEIPWLLERLAERSLVSENVTDTSVRWYLVESVRLFAFEQLTIDPGEAARVAGRHRRYYRDMVIRAQEQLAGSDEPRWLNWVRRSWDNILGGMETGLADPDESMVVLQTAAALLSLWVPSVNGGSAAVIRITAAALHISRDRPSDDHLHAIALLCWHFLWQGDIRRARALLDRSVGHVDSAYTDPESWRDHPGTDIGLHPAWEWIWGMDLLLYEQDPRAIEVFGRAQRKFLERADIFGAGRCASLAAMSAAVFAGISADRAASALELTRQFVELTEELNSVVGKLWSRLSHGLALTTAGRPDEGLPLVREVLSADRCAEDPWLANWAAGTYMDTLARMVRGGTGDRLSRAAELAWVTGVFRAYNQAMGIDVDRLPLTARFVAQAMTAAVASIGEPAARALERQGRLVTRESGELARHARGEFSPVAASVPGRAEEPRAAAPSQPRWAALSRAEREVAVLVAAGWPNSAIARRRASSVRTVDAQVASIRQKLMIGSRQEVAAFVPRELAGQIEAERTIRERD